MKKEDIEQFQKMYDKFILDCERVAREMSRYNDEFLHGSNYQIKNGRVYGSGEYFCGNGECQSYDYSFPVELLAYTEDELKKYVDNLIAKKRM